MYAAVFSSLDLWITEPTASTPICAQTHQTTSMMLNQHLPANPKGCKKHFWGVCSSKRHKKYPFNFSQIREPEWLSHTFQAFTKINVCSFSIQSRCNSFLNPTAEFIYFIYICNIKTLKIYLLVFKSSYKLMVLVYSQLIEPDGNCRKTDNKFAPQNFSPVSLNWLNGNREGKNKDLLFFTVTQRKCRLNTGSICRFQIFWRPLLLFPCIEI